MDDCKLRELLLVLGHRSQIRGRPHSRTERIWRSDIESLLTVWSGDIDRAARHAAMAFDGSRDDADDFAQSARIVLARAVERDAVRRPSYVRRLIQNAVRDALRRERAARTVLSGKTVPIRTMKLASPDESARLAEVRDWIDRLPERMRRIYALLYVEGWSQREVALLFGVSQARIAQLHQDLLRRGRRELGPAAA